MRAQGGRHNALVFMRSGLRATLQGENLGTTGSELRGAQRTWCSALACTLPLGGDMLPQTIRTDVQWRCVQESMQDAAHHPYMQGRMRVPVVGIFYSKKASCNLCWMEAMHAQCTGSDLTKLEQAPALHASLPKWTTVCCPLSRTKAVRSRPPACRFRLLCWHATRDLMKIGAHITHQALVCRQ